MITFYMRCASVFTCEVTMELDFFYHQVQFLVTYRAVGCLFKKSLLFVT